MKVEALKENEVHGWKIKISNLYPACNLSKSEKEQASQYISNKDKDYFKSRRIENYFRLNVKALLIRCEKNNDPLEDLGWRHIRHLA